MTDADTKREGCLHPCAPDAEWQCECHRRMGNDFWFLPTGSCLDALPAVTRDVNVSGIQRT